MPRKPAKFKHKTWADGSYKVEVTGQTQVNWWKMYDPLPDLVKDNKNGVYKLEYVEEVDMEFGTITDRPVYRKQH